MGLLEREMIKMMIVVAKGMRLGELQITEIMVVFPVVHRVVLVPLPQGKITGVAMVVVVVVVVMPEDKLAVVVVPEVEVMMVMLVRVAENKIMVVRMTTEDEVVAVAHA